MTFWNAFQPSGLFKYWLTQQEYFAANCPGPFWSDFAQKFVRPVVRVPMGRKVV